MQPTSIWYAAFDEFFTVTGRPRRKEIKDALTAGRFDLIEV